MMGQAIAKVFDPGFDDVIFWQEYNDAPPTTNLKRNKAPLGDTAAATAYTTTMARPLSWTRSSS
jgi:hypothetical protein